MSIKTAVLFSAILLCPGILFANDDSFISLTDENAEIMEMGDENISLTETANIRRADPEKVRKWGNRRQDVSLTDEIDAAIDDSIHSAKFTKSLPKGEMPNSEPAESMEKITPKTKRDFYEELPKQEIWIEVKTETKVETKYEAHVEKRSEAKVEKKAEPKQEPAKTKPKAETKTEKKTEPQVVAKPEKKEVAKPEQKASEGVDFSHWRIPTEKIVKVTSNYGYRPTFKRFHKGIDLKVYVGDPILAVDDGVVTKDSYEYRGYGHYIIVKHSNGTETRYAHLDKRLVKAGDKVRAGQKIGLGGNTGHSTGSHLHFEIRYKGNAIDPAWVFDFPNGTVKKSAYNLKL